MEISVASLAMVDAPPEQVRAALADYREVRPAILTHHFSGYEVVEGGRGAGSRVRWTLRASRWGRRRAREWLVLVDEVDGALVEHETRSGTVTTWTVVPAPDGRSAVRVELCAEGPTGLRGLLARSRWARLRRVHGEMLLKLRQRFPPAAG